MVGIPAASGTLTVVASTRGDCTHFIEPLHPPSRVHVEVTLRATSRRATGMAMFFTVVQKITLLGLMLPLTNPQVRTPRPGSTRWGCRGGACYFRW